MRSTPVDIMLLSLVLACSAPAPGDAVRRAATVDGGASVIPVASEVDERDACPDTRWIAYLSRWEGACPAVDGTTNGTWSGTSLFQSVGAGPSWELAPGLQPFCVYEWVGKPGYEDDPDVAPLQALEGAAVHRDCRVLVPMASLAVELSWEDLNAHFHEQVGRLDPLPLDEARPPRQVRVAVVDSVPDTYRPGSSEVSPHGMAVSRSILEIGCPAPESTSSACITRLSPHLALAIDDTGEVDLESGGSYGRISDLAVAVVAAVNAWRTHNHGKDEGAPDYHARLVVNLSVAWDDRWGGASGGDPDDSLPAPIRAVHAAITHVKCRGGLVIAAAGNDPGGPEAPTGPMLPAQWETIAAPDASTCSGFEGITYTPALARTLFPPTTTYDPLVHAAGGVRADDQPIAITRPGSRPGLAAHAAHVVAAAKDADGNRTHTAVLTGTSMAAAVTSAVAGTVWGYRAGLTGPEVMQILHAAGDDLGAAADFQRAGDQTRAIRLVLLCDSVAAACAAGKERCPTDTWACGPRPTTRPVPGEAVLATLEAEAAIEQGGMPSAESSDQPLPAVDVCLHEGFYSSDSLYAENTCPYRQWGQVLRKPWSGSQPGSYPCPTCFMVLSSTEDTYEADLYLSIDPEYPYDVQAGTIVVDGYGEIDVSVLGTLSPGDEARLTRIPILASGPFDTAVLNMRDIDEAGVERESATASELILSE